MKKYVFISMMLLIVWILVKPTAVQANCGAAIIINLPSRTLEYYVNDVLTREYSIAIGKVSTPSPLGLYTITDKAINPAWYPPGKNYSVPSGPSNPLGYRWMGFLPTYGIHGTNAPWSIGQVVSNGCIRLKEEAVEDLYELVPEGTPVAITYQRFKLKIDDAGVASIGIYPDVYGYQSVTLAQIKGQLQEYGLEGLADDSWLQQLMTDIPDRQIPFARVHKIKVNDNLINQYVISIHDQLYAPAVAVAKNLQTKVVWDGQLQTLAGKRQAVNAILKGKTVYVAVEQLPLLFGGRLKWQENENCLYLQVPILKISGQTISHDVQVVNGKPLVPLLAVAKALDQKLDWDADSGVVRNSIRRLPVQLLAGEPYLDASRLAEYFPVSAVWNDQEQILELQDPAYPMDYSMYLDQMGEFF